MPTKAKIFTNWLLQKSLLTSALDQGFLNEGFPQLFVNFVFF